MSRRSALQVAVVIGLVAGAVSHLLATRNESPGDFLAWWFGARVLLAGGNPYLTPPDVAPFFIEEQLFYPLPALVAAAPFAPLPYHLALATFFGTGSALLAYAVARTGPHRFALFCSGPFIVAALLGHWSPYLAAALLLPAAGFLIAVKPNLGIAALVANPSRAMVIGAALLVGVSLVVRPAWPAHWLTAMAAAPPHLVPAGTWLGAPLLLAALRWRRPEGRLLLAMALLPQTATFADQLLLFLVPQSRRQSLALACISAVGAVAWMIRVNAGGHAPTVGGPYVIASVYLPALAVLLRQPNAGTLPSWLERPTLLLPAWLRGTPAP